MFRELSKDYISGLTLTGGDPLHENNLDDILRIVNKIRLSLPEKTIWLYTGYNCYQLILPYYTNRPMTKEECKRWEILNNIDILVDGRYVDKLRDVSLHWRGSSNQRVIDVKQTLQKGEIVLWAT